MSSTLSGSHRRYRLAAFLLLLSAHALAQQPATPEFPAAVVDAVERVHPGFIEVLESHDSHALAELRERVVASGLPEGVPVLGWMLEHRPAASPEAVAGDLMKLSAAARMIPVDAALRALQRGDADQRRAAAIVLQSEISLLAHSERASVEESLIAALADPSVDVRVWVAIALRKLATPRSTAALARAVQNPNVSSHFYWQATGSRRPAAPRPAPQFSESAVRQVNTISPGFAAVLESGGEPEMRKLIDALATTPVAGSSPVLTWILAHADAATHGERVAMLLAANQQRTGAVRVREIVRLLEHADPDRRLAAAQFFSRLFRQKDPRISAGDRRSAVTTLIARLADPEVTIRTSAVAALGGARAREATLPLVASLQMRDASQTYVRAVFDALAAIGDDRAVPVLETWARRPVHHDLRVKAIHVVLAIGRPADRGAVVRRLLWEQPDTAMEKQVLARGTEALPLVWAGLEKGSPGERRAALALLGWFRDLRSIPRVLQALEVTRGALSRQQLIFDLNAILLTEAPELQDQEALDILAGQHLAHVLSELPASDQVYSPITTRQCGRELDVHPRGISGQFRVERGHFVAGASASSEAFELALKAGCGLAFHTVRVAHGVARVATTIFRRGVWTQTWITLHRQDAAQWTLLRSPAQHLRGGVIVQPPLQPAILRNYGAQDPLKVVRLDAAMEQVRVRFAAFEGLRSENRDIPGHAVELDRTYLPLLQPYRRSESRNIRYAAEFEVARLTGEPDVRVMVDALQHEPYSPIGLKARELLIALILPRFAKEGSAASPEVRRELVALSTALKGPRAPQQPPREDQITSVSIWRTLALVEVSFGESGYSLLFERRDNTWIFAGVVSTWIS